MRFGRLGVCIAAACTLSGVAHAAQLSCRVDANTQKHFCYLPSEVRQNGDLRSFPMFIGGPKGAERSGQTAVFNCKVGYMELRDRQGVIFARNQPTKSHIVALRNDICFEPKVKTDASLK